MGLALCTVYAEENFLRAETGYGTLAVLGGGMKNRRIAKILSVPSFPKEKGGEMVLLSYKAARQFLLNLLSLCAVRIIEPED